MTEESTMFVPLPRRTLLQTTLQAGALASLGDFAFLIPAACRGG